MSFWNTSDGQAVSTTGEFKDSGSQPIPDGENVSVMITEASWNEWEGERSIKLRLDVTEGPYKNRVIFSKLKVADLDTKKRDRAIRMFAAIDVNCGGQLMKVSGEPDDTDLQVHLVAKKPFMVKVGLWEMNGKSGNYIQAIMKPEAAGVVDAAPSSVNVDDDDIPF